MEADCGVELNNYPARVLGYAASSMCGFQTSLYIFDARLGVLWGSRLGVLKGPACQGSVGGCGGPAYTLSHLTSLQI